MTTTLFEMRPETQRTFTQYGPVIIGLTGKAGAGKDTVGEYLVRVHGFTRFAYADALKDAALSINPIIFDNERLRSLAHEHGMDFVKRAHFEARRFLQELGLAMRAVDEQFWLRPLDALIDSREARRIVVTDCRFDNEAVQVIQHGGHVFNVERPGAGLMGGAASHVSEQGINPEFISGTIRNSGSIAHLYSEIEYALNDILS